VRFDVLTAVLLQIQIFWDMTPFRSLRVHGVSNGHIAVIFRVRSTGTSVLALLAFENAGYRPSGR